MQKQPSVTLDQAVVLGQVEELRKTVEDVKLTLEELKKGLSELAERVARVEVNADVSQTGLNEIYKSLEISGLMRNGESVQSKRESAAAVREETFTCLKFEDQQGVKLGEYSVAYKQSNLVDKWTSAHNILRQSNSTIKGRYYGQDYIYSYWLYGENKIYRQKLKAKP